jgi:hypothetical protein
MQKTGLFSMGILTSSSKSFLLCSSVQGTYNMRYPGGNAYDRDGSVNDRGRGIKGSIIAYILN